MKLETKIERIKTEIRFLTEGAGTLQEKGAALDEIGAYAKAQLDAAVVAAEKAQQEQQTITSSDVGDAGEVLGL